jgi:serine protease
LNIRGIIASAAAAAATAAALAVPAAAAAPVAASGSIPASGASAGVRLPHAAFGRSLHAQFARLSGEVRMSRRAGLVPPLRPLRPPLRRPVPAAPAPAPAMPAASCTEPNCDLTYYGGPVQHNPRLYVVFWGPAWRTDSVTGAAGFSLLNFYAGLGEGGEAWSLTNSQYTDATGHPVFGASELVSFGIDTSTPPATVTPGAIATEAAAAAGVFGIKDVADAQVVVVSQPGTCFSDGFAGSSCAPVPPAYCGWHSATGFGGGQLSFTNLPFQVDAGTACGENFVNAGAAGTLDGFSIVGGHEYAEAITDPLPDTGWIDQRDTISGGEIGDKCAWGGTIWGTPDPIGNLTLITGAFAMQSLWSNATHSCVMSGTLPFSVTPLGSGTSLLRQAVSLQVHAATTPVTPLAYTAAGLPAGLVIDRATGLIHGTVGGAVRQYGTKVTVAYYAGTATFGFTWTVNAVGQVTGPWGKCLDNAGGRAVAGNKIDITNCTGKAPQRITYTAAGQLQVQGGCVTAGGTKAVFQPCSGATNRTWTRAGSQYRNKASGWCLTDPGLSKVNGTQLTVAVCKNTAGQHWSLP